MNTPELLFMVINTGKQNVRELDASENKRFSEAYDKFKTWVREVKFNAIPSPNYSIKTMNWQNSGTISNYFWARIFENGHVNSAPNISLTVNDEGLWVSLMWHKRKENNSDITIEQYNSIVQHLAEWTRQLSINKGDYEIYVYDPKGGKPNSKYVVKNKVDVIDWINNEKIRSRLNEELMLAKDGYYVIRRLFAQDEANEMDTDDPTLKKAINDIQWLYRKVCGDSQGDNENSTYWWLNANPTQWKYEDVKIGQVVEYTTHNEAGNKRRIYKYFQQIKPGDKVIGYTSTPKKLISALLEVSRGIYTNDGKEEVVAFTKTANVMDPIPFDILIKNEKLADMEVVSNRQGSLFKLTSTEYAELLSMIELDEDEYEEDNDVESEEEDEEREEYDPYTEQNFLDEVFMTKESYDLLCYQLLRKKNIILQGPPGVGKTFMARRLAYSIIKCMDKERVRTVQFHQSYSYEDFIQGYRPSQDGTFKRHNGIFYQFCETARRDKERSYFFLIDEINRGNISKILGELMMLIEPDKRGPEYAIPLAYADNGEDLFYVPENVHIIGMMNTADRSLAMIDYALRRRFCFIKVEPALDKEKFKGFLIKNNIPQNVVDRIVGTISKINSHIKSDRDLGPGFEVGHSYFCDKIGKDIDLWLKDVVESELCPLFDEYWFDDAEKAENMKSIARELIGI